MSKIDAVGFSQFCFRGANHANVLDSRRQLTQQQRKVYNLARIGWKPVMIRNRLGISLASVHDALVKIQNNGWTI